MKTFSAGRTAMLKKAQYAGLLAFSLSWGSACTTPSIPSSPPKVNHALEAVPHWVDECPPRPGLCLDVNPRTAELMIDGKLLGKVSQVAPKRFLLLEPGIHRITLKHPGRAPWRAEIAIENGPEPIAVELEPATP